MDMDFILLEKVSTKVIHMRENLKKINLMEMDITDKQMEVDIEENLKKEFLKITQKK